MLQRLDKIIASRTQYSRREVQDLVKKGFVKVNGISVRDRGARVDDETDSICVNGELLKNDRFVYLMLNKPKGVVSATNDPKQKTVIDLVPQEYRCRHLFPAGRLDMTTTGFVLITDDGDFAHRILSPKNHIEKTYEARLAEAVTQAQLNAVADGITLKDGTQCLPAKLRVLEDTENPLVEIKIHEGKYHQIKRMFAAVGNGVIELSRTKMGQMELDPQLLPGECRPLTDEELARIEERESEHTCGA